MKYIEKQRRKAIEMRDKLFRDPGNGVFMGKEREFVLEDHTLNLWEGIRIDAVDYFSKNKIAWWKGKEPSGHLLSSQIACLNHLYFIRQRHDIASAILKNIDDEVDEACIVDDGYVEFEFIGKKQYIPEGAFTRGANCTSVDAVMIGKLSSGEKRIFFIEWKYTESYGKEDKYIPTRASNYDSFIQADDSPFISSVDVKGFYYEPFYQLMRQTLLANECSKHNDHGVSSYKHIHVVPYDNTDLKENITSPYFTGNNIHDVWKSILKDESKFLPLSPEELLSPVAKEKDTQSILNYLSSRYWD